MRLVVGTAAIAFAAALLGGAAACGGGAFTAAPTSDGSAPAADATVDALDGGAEAEAAACNRFALSFQGGTTNQAVEVPFSPAFDQVSKMTVEAWIKPTTNTEEIHVVSHHDYDATAGWVLMLMTGKPEFRYYGGGQRQSATGPNAVAANVWHHLAGTFDGAAIHVFLDGKMVDTTNVGYAIAAPNNNPLRIGLAAYTEGFGFRGVIDEVRLSKVVRYTGDYAPPVAPFTPDADTVALWHMDEGTGQKVSDATGQHDGVLGSTSAAETIDPAWVVADCLSALRDR